MVDNGPSALRRRIAPAVSLTLELEDDSGGHLTRTFRLSFDFNAIALVEERTGLTLLAGDIWKNLSAKVLSIMLWASVLAQHAEYDSEEGLHVIRSFMDAGNADLIAERLFDAYIAGLPADKRKQLVAAKEKALRGKDPTPEPEQAAPPAQ